MKGNVGILATFPIFSNWKWKVWSKFNIYFSQISQRSLIYLDVNQAVCCVESLYELQALKYVIGLGKILFQSIHFSC